MGPGQMTSYKEMCMSFTYIHTYIMCVRVYICACVCVYLCFV